MSGILTLSPYYSTVCLREEVPFLCLKYITDGADGKAAADWTTSLDKAAHKLKTTMDQLKA
jgi:adenosylhomocysteine nucleosidase